MERVFKKHEEMEGEIRVELDKKSFELFKTELLVLKHHKGLRPGRLHVMTAPTGADKSTMVRTFIIDQLANSPGSNILVYLSEETSLEFFTELKRAIDNFDTDKSKEEGFLRFQLDSKLTVVSEEDRTGINWNVDALEKCIEEGDLILLFLTISQYLNFTLIHLCKTRRQSLNVSKMLLKNASWQCLLSLI